MTTKSKTQIMSHDDTVMSPITKASNVLFEDGKTAQDKLEDNVEKSFTPSVENSSSMFKVGQGDSVDYSDNVLDGAYEECVLKGKTMVNCIQESSSQDVILPYEFTEGQYVTINETKESGALGVELKGRTLVNLVDKIQHAWGGTGLTLTRDSGYTELSVTETALWYQTSVKHTGLIKLSTTYLAILEVVENTLATPFTLTGNANDGKFLMVNNIVRAGQTGIFKIKLNSKPTFDTSGANRFDLFMQFGKNEEVGNKIKFRLMLLGYQDGMENWDIPYFEGMASVKAPIVKTVGKNLLSPQLLHSVITTSTKNYQGVNFSFNQSNNSFSVEGTFTRDVTLHCDKEKFTKLLKHGETYRVSDDKLRFEITKTDGSKEWPFHFTFDKHKHVSVSPYYQWLNATGTTINQTYYPQIEIGTTATTYEPHKSSSLTLPKEVVLRSLPNGVCDTYNTRTGEYVRRIGEAVLDGTKGSYAIRNDSNSEPAYVGIWNIDIPHAYTTTGLVPGHALAENLLIDNPYHRTIEADNVCGVYLDAVRIQLKNVELSVDAYKAWLTKNPVKIQYQLATPIITKFQPQSTLKSWNATTHIYSEIPQNSLYPILSHSNPTYPVILKPSTKYSIVANSYDNNHTSSAINFNLGGATASATVGNRVTTVTTPSTLSNDLLTMSGRGNKLNNVMVIEGEVVGDEPYFEGICDVKSPVVKNVGKNLFNTKEFTDDRYIANTGAMLKDNNSVDRNASPYIKVRPKTAYIFSGMTRSGVTNGGRNVYYCEYDSNKNIVGVRNISVANPYILTTTQNTAYIRTTVKDEDLQTCVMEEASTPTAYEPHKSNTFMPIINDADVLTLTQDMFEQGNVAYNNAAMGSSYESMKESSTIRLRLKELIKVNPNSSYRVTVNDGYVVYFRPFDKNKRKLSNVDIDNPIFRDSDYTTDSRTHYISVFVRKVNDVATITLDEFNATGLGGSKEAGKIIVLRSLPNGVCDTFNTRTGEYVRRIGKIVFNGSEDIAWSPSSYSSANHYAFFTRSLSSAKNNISRPHCDKLPSIESLTEAQRDREGCMISSDGRGYGNFWIKLSSTKIENNVLSLKTYLKQNPITIQYELATPIVSTVDVQGFPYAYKDGHVQLSSSHSGQSLTPKVEYSLPINRNGQIRMNQAMVERHQKQIDELQAIILANLVNNQYKQTLATLQYELSRV